MSSAGAATQPASTPALTATSTVAPDSLASSALSPAAAKATGVSAGTQACPKPASLLQMQCQVLRIKKSAGTTLSPRSAAVKAATASISTALGPADLRAAYGLTTASADDGFTSTGAPETVAIVDAYYDPNIQSDLAQYRSNWSLPACDSTTGAGCLNVFNENGQASLHPSAQDPGWSDETALDVDMVSAICPNCHIDLFEANSANISDLGTADNSAAKVSKFVSNSWSGGDFPGENAYDNRYFNHPGVAMVFASGDYGFGATWPSSSGLVTSVGGTDLTNSSSSSSGYAETVWNQQNTPGYATAAGCSSGEGKPSWQADGGCTNRTQNDVSAVADAPYGIDEYTSTGDCGPALMTGGAFNQSGDCAAYGTSVATPIITAIYALANPNGPTANTYPVSYLYQHAHNTSDLNLVATGQVGTCESTRMYLCNAGYSLSNGYNGPTGLGTPNGIAAFASSASGNIVSVDNPGTYDLTAGTHVTLPAVKAYDSGSSPLTYSQSGLPSGVSINSTSGVISGTLPTSPVNDKVTVTVKDATGASASVHFGFVGVKAMNSTYHAGVGEVKLDLGGKCMNDPHNYTYVDAPVAIYPCQVSASQDWSYAMSAGPGQAGRITIHGKCLYVTGKSTAALANCTGSPTGSIFWELTGAYGEIVSIGSGKCLTDPNSSTVNNTQLTLQPCAGTQNQAWTMPPSPVTSGVAGKCLADSGGTAISTACTTSTSQQVTLGFDGSLAFGKYCIYNAGSNPNDGTAIKLLPCNYNNYSEEWGISAYGQIENLTTEKCLAIPGNSSSNGAKLALEDCYGQPGELWAVS